ncbi:unnamed protein product [Citrullus colocynthis]|uniref:Hydrophobic seed protein domain-containing protein n=1 Tax=Citrullus colocynthis TaxID=252529 RepID=A0ABP0YRE2_9ROSI
MSPQQILFTCSLLLSQPSLLFSYNCSASCTSAKPEWRQLLDRQCTLVQGLLDFDAAACLCNAANISLNVLDIPLRQPLNTVINIALNSCKSTPPSGFNCVA